MQQSLASQRNPQKSDRLDRLGTLLLIGLTLSLIGQGYFAIRAKQPQSLPVGAQVAMQHRIINLEVAKTEEQQQIGLMHRDALPIDRGMLFPVNPPRQVQTWMRNVSFDIDIVFVRNGRIESFAFAVPCRSQRCPIYRSRGQVDQVVELAGGQVAAMNLKVGDQLPIQIIDSVEPQDPLSP